MSYLSQITNFLEDRHDAYDLMIANNRLNSSANFEETSTTIQKQVHLVYEVGFGQRINFYPVYVVQFVTLPFVRVIAPKACRTLELCAFLIIILGYEIKLNNHF